MSNTARNPQATQMEPGLWTMMSVLCMGAMTIMANGTIAPALPGLVGHFANVPGIDVLSGLLVSLPSATILLTAGLWGVAVGRLSRQWVLVAAGLFYVAGGISGLWAQTIWQMLVGRFVLGLGVAGTMTLAMTWGGDLWHGPARARFMGMQGASQGIGGVVVMLLGGALAAVYWRGAFLVYALAVPAVGFALIQLAPYKGAAKAHVHNAQPQAAFPWRAFLGTAPLAVIYMLAYYLNPTRLPFLLEHLGVSNALMVGVILSTVVLFSIPGGMLYGRLRRHLSAMSVFALSFAIFGSGIILNGVAQSTGMALFAQAVMGFGMGPIMPNLMTHFLSHVPPAQRGRASGALTIAIFAGQLLSPLVSAALVPLLGLGGAFVAIGGLMAGVGLVCWLLPQGDGQVAFSAGH